MARSDDDIPPWPLWAAPAAILLGLGLGILATVLIGTVAQAGGSSLSHPTPAVSLLSDVAFDASFVLAAVYFASAARGLRPAAFGFRAPALRGMQRGHAWLRSLLGGLGAMVAVGVAYYAITTVYSSLAHLHGSDKLPSELGVSKSTAALVGAAVFVCVIAPMAEELFFRGFIFGALRRWRVPAAGRDLGTVLAALLTGVLFGLAHTGSASSQYLIPLGFLGAMLCLLRWWTRSLYPCIALHSINNCLALGINQEHWSLAAILGLIAAALAITGALTLPLGHRGLSSA